MGTNTLETIAGILTSVAMLLQLIKVIKDKNVEDLSILTLAVLITGLSLWIWYGILEEERLRVV